MEKIRVEISRLGKLTIYNQKNELILEEYVRNRKYLLDEKCSAMEIEAREFQPIIGGDYHVTARFESKDPNEKIYGMGQYQQPFMNINGRDILVAPVLSANSENRKVYLPEGEWVEYETKNVYKGKQWITVKTHDR